MGLGMVNKVVLPTGYSRFTHCEKHPEQTLKSKTTPSKTYVFCDLCEEQVRKGLVGKYYEMNVEEDDLLFDGTKLRNGMWVLIEDDSRRVNINVDEFSSADDFIYRARKWNRWMNVSEVVVDEVEVHFIAKYEDGIKHKIDIGSNHSWYVKRTSIPKSNDTKPEAVLRLVLTAMLKQHNATSDGKSETAEMVRYAEEVTQLILQIP